MQKRGRAWQRAQQRVAFVPTMGFLHEGHLSLVREGRRRGDVLVVSIFVNPAQFAPGEDFAEYPRDMERDLERCRQEDVDVVFAPEAEALYPPAYQTYVSLSDLPRHLCGLSRPTFFRGVATVVAKLFMLVQPNVAIFGRKDYQQLLVIRRMVRDLHFDIEIVGAPIVRETDGLAMSSRNAYLTEAQRPAARSLNQALLRAQQMLREGTTGAAALVQAAADIIKAHEQTEIDYIAVCDPRTLDAVETVCEPALMALAVRVGSTRLIDNIILEPANNKAL
jgi:pantoate--beta-alanine ligase